MEQNEEEKSEKEKIMENQKEALEQIIKKYEPFENSRRVQTAITLANKGYHITKCSTCDPNFLVFECKTKGIHHHSSYTSFLRKTSDNSTISY